MRPARVAWAAAAARDDWPSLRRRFATWRCTVCSLRTSEDAISRFEARGDEAQHLGLAPAEWRVAVRLGDDRVVEEAGERALELALVVHVR